MQVVSDIHGLERVAPPGVAVLTFPAQTVPQRWLRNFRLFRAALRSDFLVIHFSLAEVVFFTVLLFLFPFHRCRVVTLDFFVVAPQPWLRPLVAWSLGRIAGMLVYFRDSSAFQDTYRLPAHKFVYIPFKINSWELVQQTPISDDGYVFVGGRSRRDFRTLFEAVRDQPWPVHVLTAPERDISPHGSTLAGLPVPANVEIFYNDTDSRVFVEMIARARLVVLPIVKESTIQAGIGVYLMAMALHKCVVISEALGVSDVLLDGQARIVPPGDVGALREAIGELWLDDAMRQRYADAGYRYAIQLGGEDQLRTNILRALEGVARRARLSALPARLD